MSCIENQLFYWILSKQNIESFKRADRQNESSVCGELLVGGGSTDAVRSLKWV